MKRHGSKSVAYTYISYTNSSLEGSFAHAINNHIPCGVQEMEQVNSSISPGEGQRQ